MRSSVLFLKQSPGFLQQWKTIIVIVQRLPQRFPTLYGTPNRLRDLAACTEELRAAPGLEYSRFGTLREDGNLYFVCKCFSLPKLLGIRIHSASRRYTCVVPKSLLAENRHVTVTATRMDMSTLPPQFLQPVHVLDEDGRFDLNEDVRKAAEIQTLYL
jgi:hypothetical protein